MIFMIFSPGRTGIEPSEPGSLGFFDLPMALKMFLNEIPIWFLTYDLLVHRLLVIWVGALSGLKFNLS